MIPAEPRIERPVAEPDGILNIGRLFKIRTAAKKGKSYRAGIQDPQINRTLRIVRVCAVGYHVAGVFVQEYGVGFDARFKFLPAMMNGEAAVEIDLLEVVVLGCIEGPGGLVGIKVSGGIAGHSPQHAYSVGRKNMLVGNGPHGFKVVAGL